MVSLPSSVIIIPGKAGRGLSGYIYLARWLEPQWLVPMRLTRKLAVSLARSRAQNNEQPCSHPSESELALSQLPISGQGACPPGTRHPTPDPAAAPPSEAWDGRLRLRAETLLPQILRIYTRNPGHWDPPGHQRASRWNLHN